jgi:adenylate cyclase
MFNVEPLEREEMWRDILAGKHPAIRVGRPFFRRLPGEPRCKLCAAPLGGPSSPLMRLIGKGAWAKNPKYCSSCFGVLSEHRGGAEIECSLMFADVRGSTTMGEVMRPSEVYTLMDRFFDTAARVLVEHDAIVDRFVGDQAIGIFVPALAGPNHAARATNAGQRLLVATGYEAGTPWVPIGIGVASGLAFVGSLGSGSHVDLTALGDPVNVASRLASAAAPGEILVTLDAATDAGLDLVDVERRDLTLKGKEMPTSVAVIGPAPRLNGPDVRR